MDAPHISWPVLVFFRRVVERYFRQHFRAVRLSQSSRFVELADRPLIVYANHSSWWDPMVLVLLAAKLMPQRRHYAPMDEAALERYLILKRIGVFGVEMNSARGAARFLRTGLEILSRGGVLWVTPQGRFVDSRERPLVFKPGLAALAGRVKGGCMVLPLAVEYVFWDERLPEALLHFGQPVQVDGQSMETLETELEAALGVAMNELKRKAMSRNACEFELLQQGRAGAGGFYELGRRMVAGFLRRRYQPDHTAAPGSQAKERE